MNYMNESCGSSSPSLDDYYYKTKLFMQDEVSSSFGEREPYIKIVPHEEEVIPHFSNSLELLEMSLQKETQDNNNKSKEIMGEENHNSFIEKKKGRISMMDKAKGKKGKHSKNGEDNIITKIRIAFRDSCMKLINYLISKHKNNFLLRKMSSNGFKKVKVNHIMEWFDETLKTFFSADISSKFTKLDKKSNKNTIRKIYSDNELQEVITLLECSIREMYNKYINNEVIEGFITLEDTLEDLRKEGQEKDYIQKYQRIALNLEDIIKNKRSRNSKKSNY